MRLTFRHQVRSSRRFIFENIMDLDHVCVVHRRWFQNLRVIVQRADYVEYRVSGRFYGLKQEVRARGGPSDANHYWYEFITAVARMGVEGNLDGDDGNLTQTEVITFEFAAVLAPVMWLLRPLFVRQKQDILADDTSLLEREWTLEQSGFQRNESSQPRVVVYGGGGFFGRIVVQELLRSGSVRIDIASRSATPVKFPGFESRVRFFESDLRDLESVSRTIAGAELVIVAAGPFQGMPTTVLQACLAAHIPYIDLADDRDFVRRAYKLADSETIPDEMVVLIGCSVVPGLSSLLTRFAQATVPTVVQANVSISPGTKHPRGPGSFACLLSTVGDTFTAPENGNEKTVVGWTDPERIDFPAPLNARTCYRVVDIADHFVQPLYFGTKTVEFRIGSELEILNLLLSAVRRMRQVFRMPERWLTTISRPLLYVAAAFGSTAGGVVVEISGYAGEARRTESWCVFATENGERIPSVMTAIAAEMVLRKAIAGGRTAPLTEWITRDQLLRGLNLRGIRTAVRSGAGQWREIVNEIDPVAAER